MLKAATQRKEKKENDVIIFFFQPDSSTLEVQDKSDATPTPHKAESSCSRSGPPSAAHSVKSEDGAEGEEEEEEDFSSGSRAVGCIEEMEWQIFLQGSVMSSMADEELLKKYNGE
jgi:hypothetical protein